MTQKFFKGDLVQVSEMPPHMSHFDGDCQAIVIGSYTEQCGRGPKSDKQYTLFILKKGNRGEVSWYEENQLTLIEQDRFDLLPKYNVHRRAWEEKQQRTEQEPDVDLRARWPMNKWKENKPTPSQRTWVGLMRGVRVDGDTVVITVKGGNDVARKLCGELLKEKNT